MTALNPEASSAVGAYRALLPASLRRTIARRVPTGLRAFVKRLLRRIQLGMGLSRALRAVRARRRWPHLFAQGERLAALVDRGSQIALVRPTASPLGLREANLELVVSALEAAGVDHFAVRGTSEFRTCLAVSATDRARVGEAVAAAGRSTPLYVARCEGPDAHGRAALGGSRRGRATVAEASAVRVGMVWRDPGGSLSLGLEYGCDIEFWRPEDDRLVAPRPNRTTEYVAADAPHVLVPVSRLTGFAALHTRRTRAVRTIVPCSVPLPEDVRFPVDVVYTWVDGNDPAWQERRSRYGDGGYHAESANAARYISRDELRYSLRALEQHAPWVRRIYLVTDRQRPHWLDPRHPRIRVVDHTEIFDDADALPTYNSHAIESRLHHIDGLSEQFLYFNDDMFLGRPVTPQDFFLSNGMTRVFLSPSQVPQWELSLGDRPVDAAGKNNRRILEASFGSTIVQKMRHAPYPLRRSVLFEIEREFAEQHRATMLSRFRSATDISIPSSLYHYYAYFTGRAVPSDIEFAYLDLARPEIERRLGILLARRDRQAFCINDTVSDGRDTDRQSRMLSRFLQAYYPIPSPFELKEPQER
ncbi:stealth conserved region 3 domain-containing protein [Streptomyces sp. PKU-EA00015]|uniref:stealth family protein n=1 Tax=Streptomyces sp. PKU-EA00015 TaxID=2748326 RepID=UPI0015A47B24|nr:stealth family protein [Streptomyces sp. PKU-EA00015]NWF29348.1 stealth conserved region 3 domain-containing protein [Streptomyces sp. PKU-EA00015]